MASDVSLLSSLLAHLVLPPRLPDRNEFPEHVLAPAITRLALQGLGQLNKLTEDKYSHEYSHVRQSLEASLSLQSVVGFDKASLLHQFAAFCEADSNTFLFLHVPAQNAGLLLWKWPKRYGDNVIFEAFEASPLSEAVLDSNALQIKYPGSAVALSLKHFRNACFQENFANFLCGVSIEDIPMFQDKAQKAGKEIVEARSTAAPTVITTMLMTMLNQFGGDEVDIPLIQKRVRDDCIWSKGAGKPWRRSPSYLILRVALRRLLWLHFGDFSLPQYKIIVAAIHHTLLSKCVNALELEPVAFIRAKLGSRMAKLEKYRNDPTRADSPTLDLLMTAITPCFLETMKQAGGPIVELWQNWRISHTKRIVPFHKQYAPDTSLNLRLNNSSSKLDRIFQTWQAPPSSNIMSRKNLPQSSSEDANSLSQINRELRALHAIDKEYRDQAEHRSPDGDLDSTHRSCFRLSDDILGYVATITSQQSYQGHAVEMSAAILTILELWVQMDRAACQCFPLLKEFHHGFPDDMFDILQLRSWEDLCRLREIQLYLMERAKEAPVADQTMFDEPSPHCFGVRFFDQDELMQARMDEISRDASRLEEEKTLEWTEQNEKYATLLKKQAQHPICSTVMTQKAPFEMIHIPSRCQSCLLKEERVTIEVLEEPLPDDPSQAKCVAFELCIDKAFCAYRDATWAVLMLGQAQHHIVKVEHVKPLNEYPTLQHQPHYYAPRRFGLAAHTTKAFKKTHYGIVEFHKSVEDVLMPSAVYYEYMHYSTRTLARHAPAPSLDRCIRGNTRSSSPLDIALNKQPSFGNRSSYTSNHVIASQHVCPLTMSIHEFMAIQQTHVGIESRWYGILTELGSTNLNFSAERTTRFLTTLALEVGPCSRDKPPDAFRDIHAAFKDRGFCKQLLRQVDYRMSIIALNFREHACMELLIILLLRTFRLAKEAEATEALQLIEHARSTTRDWLIQLRKDMSQACDDATLSAILGYMLRAALLCRTTFGVWILGATRFISGATNACGLPPPTEHDLSTFLSCSVAIQDSLRLSKRSMLHEIQDAIIDDARLSQSIHDIVRDGLRACPSAVLGALDDVLPKSHGLERTCVNLRVPDDLFGNKLDAIVEDEGSEAQVIELHVFEGHLLIDGETIGHLPELFRRSALLQELLGDGTLYCSRSRLKGMSHILQIRPRGHQIHVGIIDGAVAIRACYGLQTFQVLDRDMFRSAYGYDLPRSLIDDCIHFLDLQSGIIEIRKKAAPWSSQASNWRINLRISQAQKGDPRRPTRLVDVHSPFFKFVAGIFQDFEHRDDIVVQQPTGFPCMVELPRVDLTWFINRKRLLYCKQLDAEIDPDQRFGTLHGLRSALVVRSESNAGKRKVLVPTGKVSITKDGIHVVTTVHGNGNFVSFGIDNVLGRLVCAADPQIAYHLALLHAVTSFLLPDLLLGRTGTEEALSLLHGFCMPSSPLDDPAIESLEAIARLTPQRLWYPPNLRKLQVVQWHGTLSTTSQHEDYDRLVSSILRRSNQLAPFYGQKETQLGTITSCSLNKRAGMRRMKFERANAATEAKRTPDDKEYIARHMPVDAPILADVMQNIFSWPSRLAFQKSLCDIFDTLPNIGGFATTYESQSSTHQALSANIALYIGPVASFCKNIQKNDFWTLAFALAPFAFGGDQADSALSHRYRTILNLWLAFAIFDDLKSIDAPKWPVYEQFRKNTHPSVASVLGLIKHTVVTAQENEHSSLMAMLNYKQKGELQRSENARVAAVDDELQALARHFMSQWETPEPSAIGFEANDVDLDRAQTLVIDHFRRLFQNLTLSRYLDSVQKLLDGVNTDRMLPVKYSSPSCAILPTYDRQEPFLSLHLDLLSKPSSRDEASIAQRTTMPTRSLAGSSIAKKVRARQDLSSDKTYETRKLRDIISSLTDQSTPMGRQYLEDLSISLDKFVETSKGESTRAPPAPITSATQQVHQTKTKVKQYLGALQADLMAGHESYKWLHDANLWPSMSPVALLECLRPTSEVNFGQGMKEALLACAVSLGDYQRALRLENAALRQDSRPIAAEINRGPKRPFDVSKYPEWLLLELECDMNIRPGQVQVALASLNPATGSNSVLQMLMGAGKTSVIMPASAAHLSSQREDLMHVVVPRSLLVQTAALLRARLGRLLGINLLHIPYSRQTDHTIGTTEMYLQMHKEAHAAGSVILAVPEHMLSFKLCGHQALADGHFEEAESLVNAQTWLNERSRLLLDESDHLLSPKSGLTFPSGNISAPDGAPFRWTVPQAVLALVEAHLPALKKAFPNSVDFEVRAGFPIVHFTQPDAENALIESITNSLTSGYGSIVPLRGLRKADRHLIKRLLSEPRFPKEEAKALEHRLMDRPNATKTLLLLRGLLVHRILIYVLKKRFNVQYGIDPTRAPIAVPFTSKGVPSERSEFGHPDVAILLTTLAFYYTGLDLPQLRRALANISKADDPTRVYDTFIQNANVPDSLRDYDSINEDDIFQMQTLWYQVRYSTTVIDYFLNHFVFAKHSKQYSLKMETNAFDLPISTIASKQGRVRTTGFSGTNDLHRLMPTTCPQQDLDALLHTNAMVTRYLLAGRNKEYLVACHSSIGQRFTERELLSRLTALGFRTLIDVGAMILELSNADVAKGWLEIDTKAKAALYFDSANAPTVRFRNGKETSLSLSNITNFEDVLVYIDESHTRGTDLPLPDNCKGALTLGLSLNKDALTQAALRLRKLGTTQSVVFLAPPEVHQAISKISDKKPEELLDSSDVVKWILKTSAANLEALFPLFWSNGKSFLKRSQAAITNPGLLHHRPHTKGYLKVIRDVEKLTLFDLYTPKDSDKIDTSVKEYVSEPALEKMYKELDSLRKTFRDSGSVTHASILTEVEREAQREVEVEVEVETVRERQHPPRYAARTPSKVLAPEIDTFIRTGDLPNSRVDYEHAFAALGRSIIGRHHPISHSVTKSRFFASAEFSSTVELSGGIPNDAMLRPVHHVLFFSQRKELPTIAMVVSPEEADKCLAIIRGLSFRPVHVLFYEPAVTRRMLHFNNLGYCAFPALPKGFEAPMWLRVQLGIFAGRLYFEYEEYQPIRDFLGITDDGPEDEDSEDEQSGDNFTPDQSSSPTLNAVMISQKQRSVSKHSFTLKPIAFMNEYLIARRKDAEISGSPMSFLLSGKPLSPEHTFFARTRDDEVQRKLATVRHSSSEGLHDEPEADHGDELEILMAGEEINMDEAESDDGEDYYHDARTSQDGDESDSGNTTSDSGP